MTSRKTHHTGTQFGYVLAGGSPTAELRRVAFHRPHRNRRNSARPVIVGSNAAGDVAPAVGSRLSTYGNISPSSQLHHLKSFPMSAADGSEPGEPGDGPDPRANEEERYRLKIAVLQEYYDAVALQTVRIRERIYQVKKQCRRLEAMKRVALNMLHQNTGTYEIPPLEIIDERMFFCKWHLPLWPHSGLDPAPSFLESVHRQQHTPPETPRKKSKRPSRSKSDGKLTAEEEERAKQKICSIIDSVYSETAKRMQTVRIRERIYQVKKQCRRLEAMKRVALNMLHQNTGTYEIPPLEIIDEDPAPSFLESVHRQQLTPPETPRKKSKRPSRSKSDGKLTAEEEERAKQKICSIIDSVYSETAKRMPSRSKSDGKLTAEEEERAKQKICSIIDSVYSETAKRMGDTPKRPMRSINAVGSSGQYDIVKRPRRLFSAEIKSEEGSMRDGSSSASAEHANDDGCRPSSSSTRFNGHPEAYMEEAESDTSSMVPYSEANSDSSIDLTYNSLPLEHHMRYDPVEGTTQSITYHNMTTALYDGAVSYSDNSDRAPSYENLVNTVYDSSLVTVQPLDYSDEKITVRSTSYMDSTILPINRALFHGTGESSAIYTNAATYANTSVTMSYNENLNPASVLDYPEDIAVMPVSFPAITPAVLKGCPDKTPDKSETSKSPTELCDSKETVASTVVCSRMIAVENTKPVEVIAVDSSGDEVSSPKPLPKRRRKYKYVVESVLDNVPYTFRQAESDDDESTEKHSVSANESHE
ncbi:hypothetical protein OSTOST_08736 [Ostertagia ostertagi]